MSSTIEFSGYTSDPDRSAAIEAEVKAALARRKHPPVRAPPVDTGRFEGAL